MATDVAEEEDRNWVSRIRTEGINDTIQFAVYFCKIQEMSFSFYECLSPAFPVPP